MKTLDRVFLIAGLTSLSFLIGVSSCDNNEENEDNSKPTRQAIDSRLKENQWKISYFYDEKDETHLFSGYSFEFNADGSVMATNLNSGTSGTWAMFNSGNGQLKMNFEFALTNPFDELNEDWKVIESSDEKIILEKARPSASGSDKLVLEKVARV